MRLFMDLRWEQGRWRYLLAALAVGAAALALALLLPGAGRWALAALSVPALFILPGLALLRLLLPRWEDDLVSLLAGSAGLSVAALPLLLAWLTWVGGRWSPALLSLFLVACAALALAGPRLRGVRARPWPSVDWRSALPLALALAVTLALRLDHIRGILMPAWSDSYQHVVVTQLIMQGGRLPASYRPLVEIDNFRYHFGFHTASAWAGWLAGWPAHQAVMYVGQILNALSPVTIYFFLAYGLKDRRAGVVGAAVAGLLTIAPANYVNFGRYPQLAGHVVLPVAMALTLRSLWVEEGEGRPWVLAGIAAAGLCLSHYRVTLFYGCFVVANLLVLAWCHRRDRRRLLDALLWTGRLGGLALLLAAPWLLNLAAALPSRLQRSTAIAKSNQYHFISWDFVVGWGAGAPLIIGAGLGALWGLVRRNRRIAVLLAWVILMFLLANPRLFGLPTTFTDNGSVVLALYLPVGMLGGYLVAGGLQALEQRWGKRVATMALTMVVLVSCIIGLRTLNRRILEPWRFFVTPDDLQAMAWIRENTPPDALFAVQMYNEMGAVTVHGVDAGYWVPYLTGRRSTLPPMPYNGEMEAEDADAINRRAYDTFRLPADHEALARLRAQGVTHAYVVEPRITFYEGLWQPAEFAADPAYRLLYRQGSVWIFSLAGDD